MKERLKMKNCETREKNKVVGGMLYIVATPIGNLADIGERALKVLSEVDFIAAEDTRNSLRMLTHFGISKTLISYHEHNKREKGEEIVSLLLEGKSCALITDAGTPAISDPGEDLVSLCAERDIPVTSIPGACALITALTLSGLPTARFVFEGFLPVPKKERRERLELLACETRTFILHEAPHKLRTTLEDLEKTLGGERRISLCRELTKLNEEVCRTTLADAIAMYSEKEPRGEYVLVIEGGSTECAGKRNAASFDTPEAAVAHFMEQGMSRNDSIKAAAKELGMSRNELYAILIK
jgi:16S rRNA (cytidine1402-2'-O)-methyltransferase